MVEQIKEPTQVILADGNIWFRQGMQSLLQNASGVTLIDEAIDLADLTTKAYLLRPQVIVIDCAMLLPDPAMNSAALFKANPSLRLIVLGPNDEAKYADAAREAGAAAYLPKTDAAKQIVVLIRQLCGMPKMRMNETLTRFSNEVEAFPHRSQPSPSTTPALTNREGEVLSLLVEGYTVKQIATELNLSVKTIEAHKFNLMRKLDVHSRVELIQYVSQKQHSFHPERMHLKHTDNMPVPA